jgi:hypothetical protein
MPSNASDEAVGAGLENYQHPVRHRDLANKNRAVQAVPPRAGPWSIHVASDSLGGCHGAWLRQSTPGLISNSLLHADAL